MKRFLVLAVVVLIFAVFIAGQSTFAASGKASAVTGTVVETMNSSGYTYVCLEKNGKKTWVAVPQMKVVKGETMSFMPGSEMTNFRSKTLNRTFDKIIFSEGLVK